MEKIFNLTSIIIGVIGGILAGAIGGWDKLAHVLIFMVVVDYLTGIMKAVVMKQLSSRVGWLGLIRKVMIFIVIAVAVQVQEIIGDTLPLREVVMMFYIANEGFSFLENASVFIPLPEKLKAVFVQIRSKSDTDSEEGVSKSDTRKGL